MQKEGRVVIITGSTRGIGEATAAEFLKNNDKVVIFCRHKDHVIEAHDRLKKMGNSSEDILSLVGDVRKSEDVKKIIKETLKKFKRIDILVNNAGVAHFTEIEKTSDSIFDNTIDTNLKGPFLFIKEVLPIMKKQKEGMIINISSGLGLKGSKNYSAYSASKFGLISLTQVTAEETKDNNILVYAVCPGSVATKLNLDIHPEADTKKMMTPEYVGNKIFKLSKGWKTSGSAITIFKKWFRP